MIYSVEKTLKDHRDKIGEAEAKNVESALEEAKKVKDSGSAEEITAALDKLTQASHKLAEAMYKASGPQQPGAGAPPPPPPSGDAAAGDGKSKDNVVDAEFVDVDDKKK